MGPKDLVGKVLLFKGVELGTITEAKFGHVPWSHSERWLFKLDCGALIRDFRDSPNWRVEGSE